MIEKLGCHAEEVTELTRLRQEVEALQAEQSQYNSALKAAGHELRNTLTSVLGFTEMMLENPQLAREQQQVFLRTIQQKSLLLNRGIQDLQRLADRDENHPYEVLPKDDNIRNLLAEIHQQFCWQHPDFIFELHDESCPSSGYFDRQRITQVLHNLLSNAVKYSTPGSRITLKAGTVQGMLRVSVADQGCGMNSTETRKAFVRYYRSSRHVGKVEGLGLGLTICQAIIQAHGGSIDLQSHPEKGTVASFTLPKGEATVLFQCSTPVLLNKTAEATGTRIH